ncbi:hypothetical protein DPM19_10425 [Actinomadura craniellae]|uniref:DUF1707 domain-containing protein n=1 Tax=Actinomadura craniellae TaxID=2231787 RepID=A0A365H7N7_9ACTN|nr:DUF1707 domain-containing protein [Actinomadura craniellae]RAY15134.1 hypothetical protein DPM19_10425 [Actinomadura craniellae]
MQPNPEMRASDRDRDQVAEALREHCAQGRITLDELQERLESTYAARTLGQLQEITADLPEEDLYALPVPAARRASSVPERRAGGALTHRDAIAAWGTWAGVSLLCFTIWLAVGVTTGAFYPWWLWVAGPWGLVLLATWLRGQGRRPPG